MNEQQLQLGRQAYQAYALFTDGKTWDGRDMPAWYDLTETIQCAWQAAAMAVWSGALEGFTEDMKEWLTSLINDANEGINKQAAALAEARARLVAA